MVFYNNATAKTNFSTDLLPIVFVKLAPARKL